MGGRTAYLIVGAGALLSCCLGARAQELAQATPVAKVAAQATPLSLSDWIALPAENRGNLADYPFATTALTKDQAAANCKTLLADQQRRLRAATEKQLAEKATVEV